MANNTGSFQQDSGSVRAADAIERGAKLIGVDGVSGHIGDLKGILDKLANEWHSGASAEHQELMEKWRESVGYLAALTEAVSIDMRTGTDNLAAVTSGMNASGSGGSGGGGGGAHITAGLRARG
jgi:uncharacterized protein YukE